MATKKKTPTPKNNEEMQALVALAKAGMTPEEIERIEEAKRAELRGRQIGPDDAVVAIPKMMYDKLCKEAERIGATPSAMVCVCLQVFIEQREKMDEDAAAQAKLRGY